MAICLTTPSSYCKLARKHVKWFISLLCHWRHSTSCVCVWRHVLVERASTQTWTLILQLSMYKPRWCTTILPLVGELHFDSRQFFPPTPPLDSSGVRFRSRPAHWAGDSIGAQGLCYTNSRLPWRRLLVVICVLNTSFCIPVRCTYAETCVQRRHGRGVYVRVSLVTSCPHPPGAH